MVKLSQLDLNEIHYFVRVVQEGNLSAASRYLQIPKSKISRKIASLEKKVGHTLLKRNTRSITLTDEGRKIFELVSTQLSDMIHQLDNGLTPQAELGGQLKIAIPNGLGMGPLMSIMGLFRKKYPGIKVHIQLTDKPEVLLKEDFDLVINVGPTKQESLVSVSIAEMDLFLFASPEYLRKNGTPTKFEDLTDHLLIELSNNDAQEITWPMTSTKGETYPLKISRPLSVNMPQAVKLAIMDHQGVGFLPWVVANPDWKEGRLIRIFPEWRVKEIPLHFLFHKHKVKNQKVKAFVSFFKSEIHRRRPGELENC